MVKLRDVQNIQTEVTKAEIRKYRRMTIPQLCLKLRMANFYIRTLRQMDLAPELKAPAIEKYRNHATAINQIIGEKRNNREKPENIRIQGKPAKMEARRF